MEKETARKLIKKTFQNPFDRDSFVYFIQELLNLNKDQIENKHPYSGRYIPDAYKKYISTLERIAKYQDAEGKELDILIVRLKKETSLGHARTMQRNFIAWYLNGSRGGKLKDAALVAFVAPNGKDWRFSLVKMEYKLGKTQTGRVRAKEELTPARRYSFLVGIHESSHTAQSRLVPILEDDVNNPTLKQLEESFNVEKVTKEFFEKYRELYHWIKEQLDAVVSKNPAIKKDFSEKNISTVDFAKKLLSQIIFLYFLQKKGWFGVKRREKWGSGSKDFLRDLFDKKHGGYQNFFNDILEPLFYEALRQDRSHDDDYYSLFDCRIPFLNGGLFDPLNNYDWVNTDIILPNELFSNDLKTKEGDVGSGILDIFDRYNFTVKEDEPLEKEVAVDPEMLGKVFENLLEVKDRKSKGTYYTPREIVHYMCQESLINYLEAETNIDKEKLNLLVHFDQFMAQKMPKTKRLKAVAMWEGEVKEIEESLGKIRIVDPACGSGAFLVGMMQEIIGLKKILSLFFKTNNLSNYQLKLKSIQNNLYGVDIDPGAVEIAKLRLWLSLVVDEEDIKQIKPLPNLDYKIVCGNSLLGVEKNLFNANLFSKLEELKPLFFNETNTGKKQEYKKQIDELINQITNGRKDFDFEVYFSEVFHEKKGFDVVIANPPYVNIFNIKDKNFRKYLADNYSVAKNKTDLYAFFAERGVSILKEYGKLVFIFSNSWLGTDSFSKFRQFLVDKTKVDKLIKCPAGVFEEATVTVVIIVLSKEIVEKNNIELLEFDGESFNNLSHSLSYDTIKSQVAHGFTFGRLIEIRIPHIKLRDVANFSLGIKTSNDKKFILDNKKDKDSYKVLRGKDIGRYFIRFDNKWMWYKPDLMNQRRGAGPRRLENFLSKPKILIKDVATKIQATLDQEGYLTTDTISILYKISGYDFRFILAILNSKLINKWFKLNFAAGLHIKINQLENIPLPHSQSINQKPINKLVDKILAITKDEDYLTNSTKQAKVRDYEKQIDQLVYKLYGLTPEEIKIVESK